MNELPQGWGSQDENFSPWNNQQLQNPPQPSSVNLTGSSTPLEQQKPEPFSQPISPNHTTASPQQPPITPVPPLFSDGSASPNVPLIDNPPSNSNTAIKAIAALLAVAAIGVSGFFIVKAIQKNKEPQIQNIAEVVDSTVVEVTTFVDNNAVITKEKTETKETEIISNAHAEGSTIPNVKNETADTTVSASSQAQVLPNVSGYYYVFSRYRWGAIDTLHLEGTYDYCAISYLLDGEKHVINTYDKGEVILDDSGFEISSILIQPFFNDGTQGNVLRLSTDNPQYIYDSWLDPDPNYATDPPLSISDLPESSSSVVTQQSTIQDNALYIPVLDALYRCISNSEVTFSWYKYPYANFAAGEWTSSLDHYGYTFIDLDQNGTNELVVAELSEKIPIRPESAIFCISEGNVEVFDATVDCGIHSYAIRVYTDGVIEMITSEEYGSYDNISYHLFSNGEDKLIDTIVNPSKGEVVCGSMLTPLSSYTPS